MTDFVQEPTSRARSAGEIADLEKVRAAAKAGYQGSARVAVIPEAVKQRDEQRAERERQAAKVHYLGTGRTPR